MEQKSQMEDPNYTSTEAEDPIGCLSWHWTILDGTKPTVWTLQESLG